MVFKLTQFQLTIMAMSKIVCHVYCNKCEIKIVILSGTIIHVVTFSLLFNKIQYFIIKFLAIYFAKIVFL